MKKSLIVITGGLLIALIVPFASFPAADAKVPSHVDLPERAGVYDVPGHPHLKLRVFVYHGKPEGKPGKPAPPPPSETCSPASSSDPDSSAVVDAAGWTLPPTWEYRLNPASVPESVGGNNLGTIAASAFGVWSSAAGNAIAVSRGTDTSLNRARLDGANIIAWGRTSGSALATSYVWYYTASGVLVEVDTIMNNKFTWAWSDPSGWPRGQVCAYESVYDAQAILTHELGHTYGLDDEYAANYAHNTMYGYGATGETKKNTLTTGDILGAQAIY